jgi:hypothetical protein
MADNGSIEYAMSAIDYFARTGLSQTGIKHLLRSSAHYKAYLNQAGKTTREMAQGSALHTMLLEGKDVFNARYTVLKDGFDGRTKKGKEEKDEINRNGKIAISAEEYAGVIGMVESVRQHSIAAALVEDGDAEVSIFAELEGVPCKARIDYVHMDGLIIDVKTCDDARVPAFQNSYKKYGYHIQAAFYRKLYNLVSTDNPIEAVLFLAVEREFPHGVMVYKTDDTSMLVALDEIDHALAIYKREIIKGIRKGIVYPEEIQTVSLPSWYKFEV